MDGTESGYLNWGPDQPDSEGGHENCAQTELYYGNEAGWVDANCAITQDFICEVEASTEDWTTAAPPTRPPSQYCYQDDYTWIKRTGPGSALS